MALQDTPNGSVELDADLHNLLSRGDFAQYHLIRAQRLMQAEQFRDAYYQCRASLAHDPKNSAALKMKAEAKAKMKN